MNVEKLFETLWNEYILLAPDALKIKKLFQDTQESNIINDHIALRTINNDICNIDILASAFTKLGYVKKDYYYFNNKKLLAYHFEHENKSYPKVFISALDIGKFEKHIAGILLGCIKKIPKDILNSNTLSSSGRHWNINYKTYELLYSKSEYAAWFYVFGFTANHFTISINHLENFDNIKDVNNFVKDKSYSLNTSGGEVKGSSSLLLEQSSTIAQSIEVKFEDGIYEIPSCFYEFAKRYKNKDGNLYSGFIEKSADLIFQSTNK